MVTIVNEHNIQTHKEGKSQFIKGVDKNKPYDNKTEKLAQDEIGESYNQGLTEYLTALVEAEKIIKESQAKDVPTLEAYLNSSEVKNKVVKSILQREIREIGKYPDKENIIKNMKSHFQEAQKDIRVLQEVVKVKSFNHVEVDKTALIKTAKDIANFAIKEVSNDKQVTSKKPETELSEKDSQLTVLNNALKTIVAFDQYLKESKAENNSAATLSKLITEKLTLEVDSRNVEYGNKGLGEILTKEQGETSIIDNSKMRGLEQKADEEKLKENNYKKNVDADIYLDAKNAEQEGNPERKLGDDAIITVYNVSEVDETQARSGHLKTPETVPGAQKTEEQSRLRG